MSRVKWWLSKILQPMKSPKSLSEKLVQRKVENSFRELMLKGNRVDFFSNDYLGLAQVPFSSQKNFGSTGSRLISGNDEYTERLETQLANFFNQEAALLFNSGYDANLGLFSCIAQKGDTIIYDELSHASIRDGIRLSFANSFSFKHNDLNHLINRLEKSAGTVFVAIESIYSMDGDFAPLKEITALCEKYNAFLIVDEAHSGGIFGDQGKGLVAQNKLDKKVFAKLITFGKAYGSHGAVVLGSNVLRNYLINYARSFIYTTALPLHAQERIEFVVNYNSEHLEHQKKLIENINFFNSKARVLKLNFYESDSPIQSIIVEGNQAAKSLAKKILEKGFAVKAILSPTVPKGKERLRICLHSFNTKSEIESLLNLLV